MFNHQVRNGSHFRVDRDGGWWVHHDDRWDMIETEAPIVSTDEGFSLFLQGGYKLAITAADAMWLSSEAGIQVRDLNEGRLYAVAVLDKFLAGED